MKDDSVFHLIVGVCRAHYKRTHDLLSALDLYRGQPPLLHLLWEEEGRTQKELGEELNSEPGTIAKMVSRMQQRGFVAKEVDEEDRRVSRIYLTDRGKQIRQKVIEIENEIEEICLRGFTAEERALLRRFLLAIRENLTE